MRWMVSVLIASSAALLPTVGSAQGARGVEMEQQLRQRRYVVQPKPDPQVVTEDIARATEAITAQQRFDRAVSDFLSPFRRRPDLDYDVSSGIQSRNLHRLPLNLPMR
jgi:hypothetical protein